MENIALLSSKFSIPFVPSNYSDTPSRRWPPYPAFRGIVGPRRQRCLISAIRCGSDEGSSRMTSKNVSKKLDIYDFARISSSSNSEMSTASATPQIPLPPPPSYIGSPLFWIGVGVGISALFSMVATKVKVSVPKEYSHSFIRFISPYMHY